MKTQIRLLGKKKQKPGQLGRVIRQVLGADDVFSCGLAVQGPVPRDFALARED